MAVEAITRVLGQKVSKINAKSAEGAVANMVKDGEKAIATADKAAEAQGRAMVKPYIRPQMETVKVEKRNLQAASGGGGTPVMTDSDSGIPSMAREYRSSSIWDDAWE